MNEQPSGEAMMIKKEHGRGTEHAGYEMLPRAVGSKGMNTRGERRVRTVARDQESGSSVLTFI